jgi:F-type H+-transporting ATPase subunit delta
MKHQEAVIAKKYAKAFLNLFIDEISLKDYQHIVELEQFLKDRREVLTFLGLSQIEPSKKCAALDSLIDKFKLPTSLKRLITILVDDKREYLFPMVLYYIELIYRQRKKILAFTVKSSASLDADALRTIEKFLAHSTGQQILTDQIVDKSLIAGIRLISNQYLWEYSIAKRLRTLLMSPIE